MENHERNTGNNTLHDMGKQLQQLMKIGSLNSFMGITSAIPEDFIPNVVDESNAKIQRCVLFYAGVEECLSS